MNELQAQIQEWRDGFKQRIPAAPRALGGRWSRPGGLLAIAFLIVFPFLFTADSGFLDATIIALAYVVMALGLNVVIGFAGLLDLGYVAFYAFGAYAVGWFASSFFFAEHVNVLSSSPHGAIGIHLNFLLVLVCSVIVTSIAGMIIGAATTSRS
jgi:branched-chain amino acid transport system permease protein